MELLERAPQIAALHDIHAGVVDGGGRIVFVSGEAGIGKTALVRAFCAALAADTVVRQGFCDALSTPRALGPLHDIARSCPDHVRRQLIDNGDRHAAFACFLDLIGSDTPSGRPSVTVVEDAHWADEATLDLLQFVGRRIAALPALVVVTYRSEEVGRGHHLRRVLGDLAGSGTVAHLTVGPLSQAAVTRLAAETGRDGARIHEVTGGNPFFVTEVLGAGVSHVPATVRDAVLARAARVSTAARDVLDAVSLVPDGAEVDLLDAIVDAAPSELDECVRSGMLVLQLRTVRFRHELARRAVAADVPVALAAQLHARILGYLETLDRVDPARMSFHADAAGAVTAVLRFAPVAAEQAARVGAHREAAAHYGRALRWAAGAPRALRADLWESLSDMYEQGGELADAIDAATRSIELWQAAGNTARAGVVMARHSHMLWMSGRGSEAHETAAASVALLETLPPSAGLAAAYAAVARLHMLARDAPRAIELGDRAINIARRHHDVRTFGRALNTVGSAHFWIDPDRAAELLTQGLAAAHEVGDVIGAGQAMANLGSGAAEYRRYALAEHWLGETVTWCKQRDLDNSRYYALAWRARCAFEQGRWGDATAAASEVISVRAQHVPAQIVALTVLGRLRVRRGDPAAQEPLDRAWTLAGQINDLERLWPVAAARAEAAWLDGAVDLIPALVRDTYALAARVRHEWATGELGYWLSVTGDAVEPASYLARPYALQIRRDPAAAATAWHELGCPYEEAVARSEGTDPDALIAALHSLRELGAWPAAELVARRMREHGLRHPARQPRRATRDNPALLTDRQVEVLRLLAGGQRNAAIAAHLHISVKTVDHHVSAILGKIGVSTRQEAAHWAAERGNLSPAP
ncbi:helix-turn-helix transcriptional regulator [Pseudonocardia sp. GCM10023141]|uniref:helix-turn-helix transcriptional regulator n=1 Tax=Pseudonocardia sp. GCM10023141 TaxID=3252653 RepID=UPI003608B2DC